MADLNPGEIVAGRYRIDRLIGAGGMGSVYEAHDQVSSQRVAVKVLHAGLQRHPVIPKRFLQEAMAARALTTPYAVKVEGSGNLPNGCPFIVMEYLDGVDLGTLARQAGGKLAVDRVIRLADQVAAALEEAHARGIVHRDLKPENVFVVATPAGERVKVVDFGISKILTREDGIKLTQTGTTLGTPQYMPMEQLRGAKDLDGRVDVYALGVMLYEVLSGARPYDGFTYEEVILKVATTTPPPLSSHRSDLPPALVDLVARSMQREREHRVGSMTEFRHVLAGLGADSQPPPGPVSLPHSSLSYGVAAPPKQKTSLLLPLILVMLVLGGVALLVVLGGAGAWFVFAADDSATPSTKAAPAATTSKTGRGQAK